MAILQHDLSEIQSDVNRIDDILKTLDDLTSSSQVPMMSDPAQPVPSLDPQQGMVDFLMRYKRLQEEVDYSITKQFKVDIKVVPNDLP